MAQSLRQAYGSDATTPSAEYPGGTFKNKNGSQAGTPLHQTWARNIDGFFQKLMSDSGMQWNGSDETALVSQYFQAMALIFNRSTKPPVDTIQSVCSGYSNAISSYSRADAAPNVLSLGDTIRDACIGIDPDTFLPVLYVLNDNDNIIPINGPLSYESPVQGSALSLSFVLTVSSIRSICSDGNYLYVLWFSTTPNQIVSAFDMRNGFARAWDRPISAVAPSDYDYPKLIVASSTHLALSWDNISSNAGVIIIPKTGGAAVSGNGNATSASETAGSGRIVSDGTTIFWLRRNAESMAEGVYLCSALISNPTTSNYSETLVTANPNPLLLPSALHNYGGSYGTVVCASPSGDLYLFVKSGDEIKAGVSIYNHNLYTTTSDYNSVMGFDGINFWLQVHQEDEGYSTRRLAFIKIPATECIKSNCTPSSDLVARRVLTNLTTTPVTGDEPGRFLFDGADMWFVSRSGVICRITNPGIR